MLPLFARIWNMRSLCGTHISARISMRWSQFRGSPLKYVQNSGACIIRFVLIDSISTPSEGEDYISSSVTYTNCFMAYLFFQTAQLLPLTLNLTTLISNTISLYMYLPPTQMLIIIHFFVMNHAPGTCYHTQSPHYLALTNLNDLCLTSCSLF